MDLEVLKVPKVLKNLVLLALHAHHLPLLVQEGQTLLVFQQDLMLLVVLMVHLVRYHLLCPMTLMIQVVLVHLLVLRALIHPLAQIHLLIQLDQMAHLGH